MKTEQVWGVVRRLPGRSTPRLLLWTVADTKQGAMKKLLDNYSAMSEQEALSQGFTPTKVTITEGWS